MRPPYAGPPERPVPMQVPFLVDSHTAALPAKLGSRLPRLAGHWCYFNLRASTWPFYVLLTENPQADFCHESVTNKMTSHMITKDAGWTTGCGLWSRLTPTHRPLFTAVSLNIRAVITASFRLRQGEAFRDPPDPSAKALRSNTGHVCALLIRRPCGPLHKALSPARRLHTLDTNPTESCLTLIFRVVWLSQRDHSWKRGEPNSAAGFRLCAMAAELRKRQVPSRAPGTRCTSLRLTRGLFPKGSGSTTDRFAPGLCHQMAKSASVDPERNETLAQ
ncbi:hypothetical protein AVEN_233278-1 [Araneus ventricosus]|uniref:Uncharacterized protein n=1 Tax=Araneus ventricosus TaxID=182803 RepID=A0A4Y2SCR7_ARAVE|nr:hypothetical protein AVEN_233278-1 [Araneus ventricosus]